MAVHVEAEEALADEVVLHIEGAVVLAEEVTVHGEGEGVPGGRGRACRSGGIF